MWGNTEQDKAEMALYQLTGDIPRTIDDFYDKSDLEYWKSEFNELCDKLLVYKNREEQFHEIVGDEAGDYEPYPDFSSFSDDSWEEYKKDLIREFYEDEWESR